MRRICAWCRTPQDGKPAPAPGEIVSHGICETCQRKMDAEIALRQHAEYLLSLLDPRD
jgi:hypothetical protein